MPSSGFVVVPNQCGMVRTEAGSGAAPPLRPPTVVNSALSCASLIGMIDERALEAEAVPPTTSVTAARPSSGPSLPNLMLDPPPSSLAPGSRSGGYGSRRPRCTAPCDSALTLAANRAPVNREPAPLSAVRLGHPAVVERLVEDRLLDAVLPRNLPQRPAGGRRLLHDLGRPVVADVRVERRRRGQGQLGVA